MCSIPYPRAVRILLVEDDDAVRDSTAALLATLGYDVSAAPDAAAALDRIAAYDPEIIITDMQMPRMSGLQLIQALHDRHCSAPVIAVSGGADETLAAARRAGAVACLPKPTSEIDLVIAIEHCMAAAARH